jgi:hypothetical protein
MKKLFLFVLLTTLILTGAMAQTSQPAAELTFNFTRQSGAASNQFAVWIENAQGQFVKTLYATRYTANGGWTRRATSIPVWVKKSNLADMTSAQVDAITGATPRAGSLTYTWDGTDSRGAPVPAGDYVIFLEGTLRWENQVLYSAPVRLGQGASVPAVKVEYSSDPMPERVMIEDVRVRTLR